LELHFPEFEECYQLKKQSLYVASFKGKTINKGEYYFLNKNRNLVFQEITGSYFISYQSIDPLSSQCC